MKGQLLTDRQKLILQYRKSGLTQKEIAEELQTTRANITLIEKSANDNIALAKEALEFVYSLEAKLVCTLSKGTDLKNEIFLIYKAAQPLGIKIQFTAGSLLNYVATCCPEKLYEDMIKEDIHVYLNNTGIIYVY
ncbi:MAG TPA: Tfx family DNA-binding protein [Methanocorpusculum sp.]|nr:Tfx family DNA-binding protein [Methanocorpusculum sp.]